MKPTTLNQWLRKYCSGIRPSTVMTSVPIFVLVYLTAYWLRFEDQLTWERFEQFGWTIIPLVAIKVFCFGWLGVYQGWSKIVTFHDLVALGKACTISSLAFAVADYLLFPYTNVPRSIFIMDWAGTLAFIGTIRSLSRMWREGELLIRPHRGVNAALILGTGEDGTALLSHIRRSTAPSYDVKGFVAHTAGLVGSQLGGVPVVCTTDEVARFVGRLRVTDVLVADGRFNGKQLRQLINDSDEHGFAVKVVPTYDMLLHGNVDLQPRSVRIEDLLRRDPVDLDQDELRQWIDGQTLLVTGSAGSIGSEICRQLFQFKPRRLVCVDQWENGLFMLENELKSLAGETELEILVADVRDEQRMSAILSEYRPDIMFHAAAYKHVPLMEKNPGEAVKNIVVVTQQLADLAIEHHVGSFVMVSTDKAVNPTNVMGACKRVAELYVQSLATASDCRFVTVRFGNVLDSAGSVVPIFRKQIAEGGPVTVTHPDMRRYFMTIPEASQLVLQAGAMGQGGEIFVLDMGSPVKIVDLAKDMIRLSGLKVNEDIDIEFIGCRPGEKLYEELRIEGEQQTDTSHPKIAVATCRASSRLEALRAVRRLKNLADGPSPMILDELKQAVPQFQHAPRHSVPISKAA